jgi:hypothetical protein
MIEQDILKYSNLNRIELLHSKESNSTNEEMSFQENAYCDGYRKGYQDAVEKAKRIIISFMPLPSNKNYNINNNAEFLEERQKYAKQVSKKFEEFMNQEERGNLF